MNFEYEYINYIINTYETALLKEGSTKGFKLALNKSLNDLSVFTETNKDLINKYPGTSYDLEKNPETVFSKKEKEISSKDLQKLGLNNNSNTFSDYINKCIGCDARLQWDWQLLPPDDLLKPLIDAINAIKISLESLKKILNSENKLNQICFLPYLFNGIPCPQDILFLIMSFKLLISKYTDFALKLKLDWFSLIGPILSSLINMLSYLVNLIFDIVVAPLDCSLATMNSGLDLLRILNNDLFATLNVEATSSIDLTLVTNNNNNLLFKSTEKFSITDLFNKNGNTFVDLSLPEQIVSITTDAKNYIFNYKKAIIEAINNFNNLYHSSKVLEINNISALIVISELLVLISNLINTNFSTLCAAKDISTIENVLKNYIENTDDSASLNININTNQNISVTLNNNFTTELKPCSTADTNSDLKKIESILSEIKKLTG